MRIAGLVTVLALGLALTGSAHAGEKSLIGVASKDVVAKIVQHALFKWVPFAKKNGTECVLKAGTRYQEMKIYWFAWADVKVLAEPAGGTGQDGCATGRTVRISKLASRAGIKNNKQ